MKNNDSKFNQKPVPLIAKKNGKRANVSWKICIICFFTLSLHLRTMKWKLKHIRNMADFKKEHEIAMNLFKYHDMLFQLYEFLGHDIVLKSGAVKRVFYDRSYDDIVFEFQSGRKDYVMDCDTDFSIGAIKTFEMEYPDVFKDFMKTYKMYDDSECIETTAADLMKMDSLPEN